MLFSHLTYFTEEEFTRSSFALPLEAELLKTIQSDPLSLFDRYALQKLDQTRDYAGIPFVLNCSFRSKAYDVQKGRSGNSAHCKGYAFDIQAKSDSARFKILNSAILNAWPRIGIYPTFIHLDCCPTLSQRVVWYGK